MFKEMLKLHRCLTRRGKFHSARLLLHLLNGKEIRILDGDDEIYESGLAEKLMESFPWRNIRGGFVVRFK